MDHWFVFLSDRATLVAPPPGVPAEACAAVARHRCPAAVAVAASREVAREAAALAVAASRGVVRCVAELAVAGCRLVVAEVFAVEVGVTVR